MWECPTVLPALLSQGLKRERSLCQQLQQEALSAVSAALRR